MHVLHQWCSGLTVQVFCPFSNINIRQQVTVYPTSVPYSRDMGDYNHLKVAMEALHNESLQREHQGQLSRPFHSMERTLQITVQCVRQRGSPFTPSLLTCFRACCVCLCTEWLSVDTSSLVERSFGMNPWWWLINRNRTVCGEDADAWRPGRWLDE